MTIRSEQEYADLITSEHAQKQRFVDTVKLSVSFQSFLQNMEFFMLCIFDVDFSQGMMLDIVGQWVGISRRVSIPITGVFFTWEDTATTGWNSGIWLAAFEPDTGLTLLGDEDYRILIKAKIAANAQDGTIEGIYNVFEIAFPSAGISIIDNQDMTMEIEYTGADFTPVQKAIISGGLIPIKPAGVSVVYTEV